MKTPASAVILALSAGTAVADSGEKTLETVLVSAARQPVAISTVGSAVTVLDSELLEHRQTASLGEILRSVPGLAVNRVGGFGAQTQVRIRGGEANHTLVFIDGIRANDPAQNGEFNWAHLVNYDIESVEVIRGPQSALWGSDALSGVINITTKRPDEGLGGSVVAEGGSNSWQNYGATGGYADDRWRASFSANSVETDGENISRQGSEDDGYENQTLNMGLGYRVTETFRLDSDLRYVDSSTDFDAIDFDTGLPADSANKTDADQLYGQVVAALDTYGDRWSHQLSYAVVDTNNKNRSENAFAPTGFDITKADADVVIYGYQTSYQLAEGHTVTGAFERQDQDFKQRGPTDFGDPNRDEQMDTNSWIFEYRAELTDAVSLLASARNDDNSDFDDKSTGRVSAAWRINDGHTKLRAAYGTGVKNPTFTERFGYYNDFVGNPDLKPEESTGWEVGVDQRLFADRVSLGLTWFQEELEDEINGFVFDPVSGNFTAENEPGNSDRKGIEFNGSWLMIENLSLSVAYTWLDATEEDSFTGEDSDEIRRPEHIASAALNWGFLDNRANLNISVDYNGKQDDFFFPPVPPFQERVELDSFTLVNIAASYQLSSRLRLHARLENAFDEDYEEVYGYVAPGQSIYAGLRYSFGG